MSFTIDGRDFTTLARDLDRAAGTDLIGELEPVISTGALRVKEGMHYDMLSSRSFHPVADAISYDVDRYSQVVQAEVGPVSAGRQVGDLAHFAYFGGKPSGGGTVRDPEYWLDWQAPIIERYAGDVLEGLI